MNIHYCCIIKLTSPFCCVQVTIDHNDLEVDEVNIISGALSMKKKCVEEIMTRVDDIFMLSVDTILDFETLSEIRRQGMSYDKPTDGRACGFD